MKASTNATFVFVSFMIATAFYKSRKIIKKISHIAKSIEITAFYSSCVGRNDAFCIILQ